MSRTNNLLLSIVLIGIIAYGAIRFGSAAIETVRPRTIRYSVDGVHAAYIAFSDAKGAVAKAEGHGLPWSTGFEAPPGLRVSVSAVRDYYSPDGSLACAIYVDGQIISRQSTTGDRVDCEAAVP